MPSCIAKGMRRASRENISSHAVHKGTAVQRKEGMRSLHGSRDECSA